MRYTKTVNGFSSICLNKMDILSPLKQIKICTGYIRQDGSKYEGLFPATLEELATLKPKYEVLPGWETDITNIRDYDQLPINARKYIEAIEEFSDVPVGWIGVGPERASTILKKL